MSSLRRFLLRFYRYLAVMPWRGVLYSIIRKHSSARADQPSRPHPIDVFYGIATSGEAFGKDLESNNIFADLYTTAYAGSQPSIVRRILRMIPNLEETTFLDLGCGKGRALAVATEFPFQDIIGVELSPKLAALARQNARVMQDRFPDRTPITLLEGDASTIMLPEGTVIVFLYHPFFKRIMKKIAAIIKQTLAANPHKKIFVFYINPLYGRIFDRLNRLQRFYAGNIPFGIDEIGTGFPSTDNDDTVVVWESLNDTMCPPSPHAKAKIVMTRTGWRARVVE